MGISVSAMDETKNTVRINTEPKYRRPLNDDQIMVLRLLYRFRFASSEYIARYFNKPSSKHIQKRLKILEDQGYIAKLYDKTYKLRGKPAAYYLTPKGARIIRTKTDKHVDDKVIKSLYKNKNVSEDFIQHCLTIFTIYLHFRTLYGDKLLFFTRSQLVQYDYFPGWMPDAYIRLTLKAGGTAEKQFFLDMLDETRPFFVHVRKVRNYLKYSEEGDWESETNTNLPAVLMICDTQRSEKKLRRQLRKALDESYEEVIFATTTAKGLMQTAKGKDKVWRLTGDEDEMYLLGSLPVSSVS